MYSIDTADPYLETVRNRKFQMPVYDYVDIIKKQKQLYARLDPLLTQLDNNIQANTRLIDELGHDLIRELKCIASALSCNQDILNGKLETYMASTGK